MAIWLDVVIAYCIQTTMSNLFIIATPIGNLEDLTLRATRLLREVPVVVAEDTRVTRKILAHIDANPKLISFHRQSSDRDITRVMGMLNVGDVALVSDAGTPGVNDPGQLIVSAAIERGHEVVPLPGPSSIMTALSVSGFYVDRFTSYGFLPAGGGKRRRLLQQMAHAHEAAVFFETPHRLRNALQDMATEFSDRGLVICREMTKRYEEIWRGTATEAIEHFHEPRGEFVIVVSPLDRQSQPQEPESREDAERRILATADELTDRYSSRRDLVEAVAEKTQLPKRQVYQTIHR